jgi:hypothetical protein
MQAILVTITAVEALVICALLFILICRDQGRSKEFKAAMQFALKLDMLNGRWFMRAYLAGNSAALREFFPTWQTFRVGDRFEEEV